MSSSESTRGSSSSSSAPGIGTRPPVGIGTAPPITITAHPSYLPPPARVSPANTAPPAGSSSPPAPALPGDLFASWRSLMTSVGQTVPYHLNRAVTIARLLRRGS